MSKELLEKLRKSELSKKMRSLESCDFLAYIEYGGKMIGASGVGGIFHVPSLQIDPNFHNRGLGARLFFAIIKEAKNRKYSFLSGSRDPNNINAVKIHDHFKLFPLFQVPYRKNFTRDVVFLEFNRKGKIIKKLLKGFNNKIGIGMLIISIKILRNMLFKFLLTYPAEEFPSPDISYAIKNFKKIMIL